MIYLLEDDESIRELVCYSLTKTGTPARGFQRPSALYAALERERPELLLLDVMLPEEDGLSVLSRLRKAPNTRDLPIIMLTAKGSEFDKVSALDAGADDYITKPFGIMELCARVKAVLRRVQSTYAGGEGEIYRLGALTVSVPRHEVTVGEEPISLTGKEFELLCLLLAHRGTVLTRDKILREIWGYEFDGENRTVDVHIRTLRGKLGEAGSGIETVRGYGYRIGEDR